MQKPNEGPQRTCVGCMSRDSKERMLRIAVTSETLTPDEQARRPGRGAYLHRCNRCISKFVLNKRKQLRSLRRSISLEERRKVAELIRARLDSSAALD
jgi:predicted RNA-binding protein YlxR (DUF448 family)